MRALSEEFSKLERAIASGDVAAARALVSDLREKLSGAEDSLEVAILNFHEARILTREGDYDRALEVACGVLEEFRQLGAKQWVGWAHLVLAAIQLRRGLYGDAKAHAEAAIYHYTWEVKDKDRCGRAYDFLGLCYKNLGRWVEAEACLRKALETYDESCDLVVRLRSSLNFATVLRRLGRIDEAIAVLSGMLECCSGIGDVPLIIQCRLELANLSVVKRELGEARRHVGIAAEIADREGLRRERVLAKEIEGDIEVLCGDYDRAEALYRDGLSEAVEFASGGDLEYEILSRLSRVHVKLGRLEEARCEAERAIELTERCGDRYEHALGLRALGEVEVAEGRIGVGIDYLRSSVSELRELSEWTPELGDTELELGRLMRESGDSVEGLEHLFVARRVYTNLGFGEGIREVDGIIAGLVSVPRLGLRGAVRSSRGYYGELSRYGIVTVDERIVGDVSRWGPSEMRVLIEGETGVGKELIARAMHAMSRRREGRLMVIDCGSLSESLSESELFGHARGSFTGADRSRVGLIEEADGGTLFLDEVGELSERMQVKLLRVLEEGCVRRVGSNEVRRVDFRVISATTRDLMREVESGRFRRDLYYRLRGVLIRVPSLRERPYDVRLLLEYYLGIFNDRYGKSVRMSEEVLERLMRYSWPGNVRELRNLVEALVVGSSGGTCTEDDLNRILYLVGVEQGRSAKCKLNRISVRSAMVASNGSVALAAKMLGVSRQTIYRWLKEAR